MKTSTITKLVIIVTAAALIIYDIFIVVEPTPRDTLSRIIFDWALKFPIVPFFCGVITGHFFWKRGNSAFEKWSNKKTVPALLITGLPLITISIINGIKGIRLFDVLLNSFYSFPILVVIAGVLVGHYFWGQVKH